MTHITDELKPCPFCGGEAKLLQDGYYEPARLDAYPERTRSWVVCSCDTHHKRNTAAEAIAAWNTRAMQSASPEGGVSSALREALVAADNYANSRFGWPQKIADQIDAALAPPQEAAPACAEALCDCPGTHIAPEGQVTEALSDCAEFLADIDGPLAARCEAAIGGVNAMRRVLFDLSIAAGKLVTATDGQEAIRAERRRVLDFMQIAQQALTTTPAPADEDAEWRADMRKTLQIVEQRLALSRIAERYPPDTVAGRLAADVLAKYPNRFENADRENDCEPFPIPEIEGLPLGPAERFAYNGPPCPTCGVAHPFDNVFCSDGFHSPVAERIASKGADDGLVVAAYEEGWNAGYSTGEAGGSLSSKADDWSVSNARAALSHKERGK